VQLKMILLMLKMMKFFVNVDNEVANDNVIREPDAVEGAVGPAPKPKRKYTKRRAPEREEPRRLRSRVIEPIVHQARDQLERELDPQEGKEQNAGQDVVALLTCLSNIILKGSK